MADPYYYPMDIYGQIAQYRAATGRYRPDMLEPAIRARLSAVYESGMRRRALNLQEKELAQQQSQYEQTMSQRQSEFAVESDLARKRLGLAESEAEAQKRAAMVSGGAQLAQTGIQGAAVYGYGSQAGWWGGQAAAAGGPSAYGSAMGTSGAAVGSGEASGALYGAGSPALGYAGAGGAGFTAGYVGGKYGPFQKQSDYAAGGFGLVKNRETRSRLGAAGRGAGAGAIAGTMVSPGIGTAIGAILGAVGGYIGGGK